MAHDLRLITLLTHCYDCQWFPGASHAKLNHPTRLRLSPHAGRPQGSVRRERGSPATRLGYLD